MPPPKNEFSALRFIVKYSFSMIWFHQFYIQTYLIINTLPCIAQTCDFELLMLQFLAKCDNSILCPESNASTIIITIIR